MSARVRCWPVRENHPDQAGVLVGSLVLRGFVLDDRSRWWLQNAHEHRGMGNHEEAQAALTNYHDCRREMYRISQAINGAVRR